MAPIYPNPRKRFGLEMVRFGLYLTVPVVAITVCSDPKNMHTLLRKFNFVEYPPEEGKKLPSGDDIVKMMEERNSKRLARKVDATRAALNAHLVTDHETSPKALSEREKHQHQHQHRRQSPAIEQRAKESAAEQATGVKASTGGWLRWLRQGGAIDDNVDDKSVPK